MGLIIDDPTLNSGNTNNDNTSSTQQFLFITETAALYVKLYPWHSMTPTLQKIVIYESEVIQKTLLPIGQLLEEALEARNKHIRLYHLTFARKFSQEVCNMDILNWSLIISHHQIWCLDVRRIPKKVT